MDKSKNEMTDEQKKVYYVIKISKLSSEEYKLEAGKWVASGICLINCFLPGINPKWPFSPSMAATSAAIVLYCMLAQKIKNKQQSEAYNELAKLNDSEGKSR